MTASYPVVTDEAFPGEGVMRCTECGRELLVGYPYSTTPDGMVEDTPMSTVVCVYCGPRADS
jgi:DNA-directed RNA polymerase subunit RPC12/RpoP